MSTSHHVLILLTSALLLGCGGGGGGGEPDSSLSGWWAMDVPPSSGPDPQPQVLAGPARHQGASFVYLGIEMVKEGDSLTGAQPDFDTANRLEYHLTVVSTDRIEGTLHAFNGGVPSGIENTTLLRTPPPSGLLTAAGNLQGGPVDLGSSTAYAYVDRTAAGGGADYTAQLLNMRPVGKDGLTMSFFLTTWWAGSIVMDVTDRAHAALRIDERYAAATDGTITLTRFDGDRIQGEYELIFGLDGVVQGTFNVPVLETY